MCSADDVEFILCYSSQQSFIFPKVSNYFLRTTWSIRSVQPWNINYKTHNFSLQTGPCLKTQTEQKILLFHRIANGLSISVHRGKKNQKREKAGAGPFHLGGPQKALFLCFSRWFSAGSNRQLERPLRSINVKLSLNFPSPFNT